MGCTASTMNTKQNCLNIVQIFESRDLQKKTTVNLQTNYGSPVANMTHNDDEKSKNDLQETCDTLKVKNKPSSEDEGQGEPYNMLVCSILKGY